MAQEWKDALCLLELWHVRVQKVMLKKRKARRSLTTHTKSIHQQNNVANNVMAHMQESDEIAPSSTKVYLQCEN